MPSSLLKNQWSILETSWISSTVIDLSASTCAIVYTRRSVGLSSSVSISCRALFPVVIIHATTQHKSRKTVKISSFSKNWVGNRRVCIGTESHVPNHHQYHSNTLRGDFLRVHEFCSNMGKTGLQRIEDPTLETTDDTVWWFESNRSAHKQLFS